MQCWNLQSVDSVIVSVLNCQLNNLIRCFEWPLVFFFHWVISLSLSLSLSLQRSHFVTLTVIFADPLSPPTLIGHRWESRPQKTSSQQMPLTTSCPYQRNHQQIMLTLRLGPGKNLRYMYAVKFTNGNSGVAKLATKKEPSQIAFC